MLQHDILLQVEKHLHIILLRHITTLDTITTQALGTIRTLAMGLGGYIIMLLVDIVVLTIKLTLEPNTPTHQPMALFKQQLTMCMQEGTMDTTMWDTEELDTHTVMQMEATSILIILEMEVEWTQVEDTITDPILTAMV